MWSRSSTPKEAPAPATPPPSSSLSLHARAPSNPRSPPPAVASPKSKGKLTKESPRRDSLDDPTFGEEDVDDDVWGEDSDDEQAIAKLAASQRKLANLSVSSAAAFAPPPPANSAAPGGPASPLSTPAAKGGASTSSLPSLRPSLRSASSWSFNPFSIIAPSPKSAEPLPLPVQGPEAVAAVLAGEPVPVAPISAPKGHVVAESVGSKPDKQASLAPGAGVEVEDVEDDQAPPEVVRRSSTYQMEQWKAAIKPDVEEIVKDPMSLLSRLSAQNTLPPAPPSPTKSRSGSTARRPSMTPSERDGGAAEDDEDDDPAAGYVPLNALNLSSVAPQIVEFGKEEETVEEMGEKGRERRRRTRFIECLGADNVDLTELRKLAWAGIPNELRPMSWQLLLGYLPAPASRRLPTLARKRQEYADAVRLAFSRGVAALDGPIWHQISIDVPRTNPGVRLWQGQATQRSLERILYVWAIRHPASGYVQGINDLVTPFFEVFLSSYITDDPETYDVSALPPSVLEALEADSFWCLSKLLDGIQDNYIFAQPGIVRQVGRMKELCSRVDAPLSYHLEENNVEFMQFAFRWVNCLLMREMSVKNIIRMWDTYLAEGADAFSEFHLYVCLAFLVKWSEPLRGMDFQSIIMFLQSLPTQNWTDKNTELLLSEAFMWSRTFEAR